MTAIDLFSDGLASAALGGVFKVLVEVYYGDVQACCVDVNRVQDLMLNVYLIRGLDDRIGGETQRLAHYSNAQIHC